MAATLLKKLDVPTLNSIAQMNHRTPLADDAKKTKCVDLLLGEIDEASVKQMVFNMKRDDLMSICEYLEIDHGNNNAKNKMVLTKRIKESMTDDGINQWLTAAPVEILELLGNALGIPGVKKMGARPLRAAIEEELETVGLQILFHNLDVGLLKEICAQMKLKNYEDHATKSKLVQAIVHKEHLPEVQKKKRKPVRKPKFAPIEECKTYDQLFQYYKLSDLEEWARAEGVKTSGPKKALINRILAYLEGDKENTMTAPKDNKPKKKQTTKSTKPKKPVPEPSRHSSRIANKDQDSDESESEEDEDAMEVEKPVKQTKNLKKPTKPTPPAESEEESNQEEEDDENVDEDADQDPDDNDDQMDEQEDDKQPEDEEQPSESMVDVEESESERSSSSPTSLEGLKLCITGTLSVDRKTAAAKIEAAGGTLASSLTKSVNVLIVGEGKGGINSKKYDKARTAGVLIVDESYLKNIL